MNYTTKTGKILTDEDITAIADEFQNREFTPEEVAKIKKTRRSSPRLGSTNAKVIAFRAPAAYKDRIKARAKAESKSESQVIRDAIDAYLQASG